jgi:glycosyltransferase involved in cell wall biosynthesis
MKGPKTPSVCLVGLIAGGHSGVPRYAAKLIEALDSVAGEHSDVALRLLTNQAGAEMVRTRNIDVHLASGRSARATGGPRRILLEQLQARKAQGELLHFFDTSGPVLSPRRPFVTTFHDAAPIHGFRRFHNAYKRRLFPWALRHARAVIAVSQFAKDEAVRHFDTDPDKVVVVHSGPGLGSTPTTTAAGELQRDGTPFLLYVGNIGVNKNLPLLIRAFHRASVPARLVLAGNPREGAAEVHAAIAHGPRSADIDLIERPDDTRVDNLYRTATALVLPSTYEGFGFTPLEAMARGCPVVASDIPAIREVAGTGATLVDPAGEAAWTAAIDRIIADDALRSDLRVRGHETVRRYSWLRTARSVLSVFASLLSQPR